MKKFNPDLHLLSFQAKTYLPGFEQTPKKGFRNRWTVKRNKNKNVSAYNNYESILSHDLDDN